MYLDKAKSTVQKQLTMTIKDAIICVLSSERCAMTVEEIYNLIEKRNLYSFGARNPESVIRITIERACKNTNYSNRNVNSCFRSERNHEGKRVYALLAVNSRKVDIPYSDDYDQKNTNIDAEYSLVSISKNTLLAVSECIPKTHSNCNSKTYSELHSQNLPDTLSTSLQKAHDNEFKAINICLEEKYTNGFRYESQIELNKLRRYVLERFGITIKFSDVDLSNFIKSCGMIFEGKVYIVSTVTWEKIKSLSEYYFDDGGQVIFYEEFFSKYEAWLIESSVVSEEMLIVLLHRLFPQYSFTQTYFGTHSNSINKVIVSEILRVWDYDTLLSYDELSERLVYIPRYRIELALGQNCEFIWNSMETFTHTSKVDISEGEKASIYAVVTKACNIKQFISFVELPLDDIAKRNTELTETAIHTAVYQICLVNDYEKSGKIITKRGKGLSVLEIITEYCHSLDRVTLQELLDFEKELTGKVHRWTPIQAGYDVMVRISEDDYIADKYIHFNVLEIDTVIEMFMVDEYIPLRSITTFALFPHCGQPWNLFLLESYVRRFSINFRFATSSVNNKNAGCIVRKHSKLTYDDVMVDVILKKNVPLMVSNVTDFLFNNGYRASRQKAKVSELIKIAKQLCKRRS